MQGINIKLAQKSKENFNEKSFAGLSATPGHNFEVPHQVFGLPHTF